MGAISNPTHDQNAANSAMPAAPAPNTLIAAELPKISAGLSGARERPSAPPWPRIATLRMVRAATSETSATPSTFAVSSMWNHASRAMITSEIAMKTQAGIDTPVQVSTLVAAK